MLTTRALWPASAYTAARLATTSERLGSVPGDTTMITWRGLPLPLPYPLPFG